MNRIRALNEESSEESEGEEDTITKEAQEQSTFTEYNQALIFLRESKFDEAGKILRDLLDSPFLSEYTKPDVPDGSEAPRQPVLMLKYSCLKNMGNILAKEDNLKAAIEYYLQASYLDGTDVTLWLQIGKAGVEVVDYKLALDAFSEGLHCSPRHWPCLDGAISMLFVLGDDFTCLHFISRALTYDPDYLKGLVFRDKILAEIPSMLKIFKEYYPEADLGQLDYDYDRSEGLPMIDEALAMKEKHREKYKNTLVPRTRTPIGLVKPLAKKTWLSLGRSLMQQYLHLSDVSVGPGTRTILDKCESNGTSAGAEEPDEEEMEVDEVTEEEGDTVAALKGDENEQKDPSSSQLEDDGDADDARGKKRRRSSLSFIEQWMWGGKRRSARVRSTARKDADDNLGQALRSLVPHSLLPGKNKDLDLGKGCDDSQDTMELYKLFKQSDSSGGNPAPSRQQLDKTVADEGYFFTDREKDDVERFLRSGLEFLGDILDEYYKCVSEKWHLTWPKGLAKLYVDLYSPMRNHNAHPSPYDSGSAPDTLESDARVTLLYCELLLDGKTADGTPEFPVDELGQLQAVAGRGAVGAEGLVRMYWLKGKAMLYVNHVDDAIQEFEGTLYHIEESASPMEVRLPNVHRDNVISLATATRQLNALTRRKSLSEISTLLADRCYDALALILQETLKGAPQPIGEERDDGAIPDRRTQLEVLMEALQVLERYQDCFYWGEACFHEAFHTYLASDDAEQQEWATTLQSLLTGLLWSLENGGLQIIDALGNGRLSRVVQNLTHVLCHQLEAPDACVIMPIESVAPWIVLQKILQRCEERSSKPASDDEGGEGDEAPASIRVMVVGHEYLARRSWCCYNDGAFLLHMLNVVVPRLRDPALASCSGELNQALEQTVYCLYGHPSKKVKGRSGVASSPLQEHGVPQIPLTWQLAVQLFQMHRPEELPEFDSYRVGSITSDVESLLKRILTLMPTDCDPAPTLALMNKYIDGTLDELPVVKSKFPRQMAAIYYLLADFYFKNNEWAVAVQHYLLDVCLNPHRLDSWAGMALARGSQLEMKLNSCQLLKSEADFLRRASAAQRCYKRSLEIDASHSLLWIEYGSFVYMVHSFCCRLLKQENEGMNMQMFVLVEKQKEEMLAVAVKCFQAANKVWYATGEESGVQDERWLHHYMLGKAAEKTDSDPESYLSQYAQCVDYLHQGGATYPRKISYNNPQNLAVEALEVYYRIHASILKYLEAHEGKGVRRNVRDLFEKFIAMAREGPFITKEGRENDKEGRENDREGRENDREGRENDREGRENDKEEKEYNAEGKKRAADEPIMVEDRPEAKRPRVQTDPVVIGAVIDTMEEMIGKLSKDSITIERIQPVRRVSNSVDDVIMISDDSVSEIPPFTPVKTVFESPKTPSVIKKTAVTVIGSGPRTDVEEVVDVSKIDAVKEPKVIPEKNVIEEVVEESKYGEEITGYEDKMDVAAVLTMRQIRDIIGIAKEDPEVENVTEKRKAVDELVGKKKRPALEKLEFVDEKPNSNSFEDNFLKFISTSSNPESEVKEDELDVKANQEIVIRPSEGVKVVEHDVTKVEKRVEKSGAAKDGRRCSQESTTTNTTTTGDSTLTTSSDDESSSDSSESSSSSESESTESDSADKSMETVVDVATKKAKEKKEAEKEAEAEKVAVESAVPEKPKEDDIVKDNTDLALQCVTALEECVMRFPQHYKSLYRLGHFYFRSRQRRDVAKCRDLLLATYRCMVAAGRVPNCAVQGLFADRKASNFFNGVWRIPVSEIDRPGSFASHMSRCVQLLMDVLTELKDQALLLELCIQLRRTPESDKKYLRDSEREQLSRQALSLCLRAVRAKMNGAVLTAGLVLEVYKCYQRAQKHLPHKEKVFANLLQDAYRQLKKLQGPVLEQAVKYCQQELITLKLANIVTSPAIPTSPQVAPSSPFTPPIPTKPAKTTQPKPNLPPLQLPRSRGRPPNVPRSGAPGTGFEYPKAANAAWKPGRNTAKQTQQQQYANMLAQSMPYYGMHSLFSDMSSMAGLANYNVAGLAGANLNMASINAANMSMTGLGAGMSNAQMLEQQLSALNMLNYQVQLGNYQSELMRHYGSPLAGVSNPLGSSASPLAGAAQKSLTSVQKSSSSAQKSPSSSQKSSSSVQKSSSNVQKIPSNVQKTPSSVQKTPLNIQKPSTSAQKSSTMSSPTSLKDRPSISITAVGAKPAEKSSPSLQEKMLAVSQNLGKSPPKNINFSAPSNVTPTMSKVGKVPNPELARIAAKQLADLTSKSRLKRKEEIRNKPAPSGSALGIKPLPPVGLVSKSLPSPNQATVSKPLPSPNQATVSKDNRVIGSGVSITQVQQPTSQVKVDATKPSGQRKSNVDNGMVITARNPIAVPKVPDLSPNLLKGMGASLTLVPPRADPKLNYPAKFPKNAPNFPYKTTPPPPQMSKPKKSLPPTNYNYQGLPDPRSGMAGSATKTSKISNLMTGALLPQVHDLTSKFAQSRNSTKTSPFPASVFEKFSYMSSPAATTAEPKPRQIGSEITVTPTQNNQGVNLASLNRLASQGSQLEIIPKPLDLAAIPKGITITNVATQKPAKIQDYQQKGVITAKPIEKLVAVKKTGKDNPPPGGSPPKKTPGGASWETITLD